MKGIRYKKKESTKEKKEKKPGTGGNPFRAFLYSAIVAFALLVGVIHLENFLLSPEVNHEVYIASKDIESRTLITAENVDELFTMVKRGEGTIPEGYITDTNELIGMLTGRDIQAKEVILESVFIDSNSYIAELENPVEVSIQTNNLSQIVGGVLRAGDQVNIWSIQLVYDNGTQRTVTEKVCEKAYITRAFSSAGVIVNRDDANNADTAMVINIVIPGADEEAFNAAVSNGTIRISRIVGEGGIEDIMEEPAAAGEVVTE